MPEFGVFIQAKNPLASKAFHEYNLRIEGFGSICSKSKLLLKLYDVILKAGLSLRTLTNTGKYD